MEAAHRSSHSNPHKIEKVIIKNILDKMLQFALFSYIPYK